MQIIKKIKIMSVLTYIKTIPLFSTPLEAVAWGRQRGLTGYHTHAFNIRNGYMGGSNHRQAIKANAGSASAILTTPQPTTPTQRTTTTPPTIESGDRGGY